MKHPAPKLVLIFTLIFSKPKFLFFNIKALSNYKHRWKSLASASDQTKRAQFLFRYFSMTKALLNPGLGFLCDKICTIKYINESKITNSLMSGSFFIFLSSLLGSDTVLFLANNPPNRAQNLLFSFVVDSCCTSTYLVLIIQLLEFI